MNNDSLERYNAYIDKISSESIPQYEPFIGQEEIDNVVNVLKGNWLSEGMYTRQFEDKIKKMYKMDYALACANGTGVLIMGLKAFGIGQGDEVIVPSYTHPSDVNCIYAVGATPKFCDIDLSNYCISPNSIIQNINKKTKAILVVHLFGFAAEMDKIINIGMENDIPILEDCAQALGTKYNNKLVGSFGDFGMLSFFADKTITTGEGGMLITNNQELIDEVNIYKHDGRRERGLDLIERQGYNFRITDIQSAIGVAQFDRLKKFINLKRILNETYIEKLKLCDSITIINNNSKTYRVPHRVVINARKSIELIDFLAKKGIGCRRSYRPMHSEPICNMEGAFPNSVRAYSEVVCLPSHPMLEKEHVDTITNSIFEFYS